MKRSARRPAIGAIRAVATGQASGEGRWRRRNGRACPRSRTAAPPWPGSALRRSVIDVASDSANTGRRRRSTGSSGAGSSSCRLTRTTPIAAPSRFRPAPAMDFRLGRCRLTPAMKSPKASALRTTLIRSRRPAERGVAGSVRAAIASASAPIGTLIRNSQCQEATERIAAATLGLAALATATTTAMLPTPWPSRDVRIDEPDERDVDAHDPGGAEALNQARERQHGEARRERAGERGDGEDGEPPPIDAPVAEHVAERSQRQQRNGDRELEGVDDPCGAFRRDGELARHRRQRHGDDVAVEHRHGDRHAEGRERKEALRIVEAVVDLGSGRRGHRLWAVQGGQTSPRLVERRHQAAVPHKS